MTTTVGFIGLGIMGQGMCHNLLKAGYDLLVWNRTAGKMAEFITAGAKPADSPADLARQCSTVLICVSDTPDVVQVVLGENGLLHGIQPGS